MTCVCPVGFDSAFLKVFFSVVKLVLVALLFEDLSELGRAAEKDGDLALLGLSNGGEHLVPVGTTSVGAGLQAGDQIALGLKILIYLEFCNFELYEN